MNTAISPQKIYDELQGLPDDSLAEIWQFIEFLQFKNHETPSPQIAKLGGILSQYDVDISEEDISQARQEMWGNLGDIPK